MTIPPKFIDPPPPANARALRPGELTPELQAWALALDHDPVTYPLGAELEKDVGAERFYARVVEHTEQAATGRHGLFHAVEIWHLDPDAPRVPHTETGPLGVTLGVDVSDFQGVPDLAQAAAAGYAFAYVKLTEGVTWTSSTARATWQRAGDAGMLRGGYHFFRTTSAPADQVRHFLEELEAMGGAELPPMIDVEWQRAHPAELGGVQPGAFLDAALQVVEAVAAATGRRPLFYTAPGFASLLPPLDRIAEIADLHQAEYGPSALPIAPWGAWKIWQFDDRAEVPGIGVRADVNRFAGDLDALRVWASGSSAAAFDGDTLRRLSELADGIDHGDEGLR